MYKNQRKSIIKYLSVILFFILFCGYGCMPPRPVCIKNGKDYCKIDGTFGYEWFDYYRRALSCIEGEFYEQALTDLNKAEKQRFEDQRMAKIYGMRLMDYFPHREKGLIYYLLGDYDTAKSELELSIRHYPSEKASHYLDKVRKHIMEREKIAVSVPRIFVESDIIWTKADSVMVSGIAEDEQYISEIIVDGIPIQIEFSGRKISFEEILVLNEGKHDIDIIARNLMGGQEKRQITIYADRSGPTIILTETDPAAGVKGYLYDESGEISLTVNGEKKIVVQGKESPFSLAPESGQKSIVLLAEDKLGNQTEANIHPEMIRESAQRMNLRVMLAQHSPSIVTDGAGFMITGLNPQNPGPEIILNESLDQNPVFEEMIALQGQVRGKRRIEEILINGVPVHRKPGQIIFFNHSLRLRNGENQIVIRAQDESGAETIHEMVILRQVPEPLRPEYRCTFKTNAFKMLTVNDAEPGLENLFRSLFLSHLISKKRFHIRVSEKLYPGAAERAVRFMLSGYVHKTRNGIEIVAQVSDMQTSQILNEEYVTPKYIDIYSESADLPVLKSLAAELSEKFHTAFPLVKGKIIRKGERVLVLMEKTVRMEWPLVVGTDTEFIGDALIAEGYQSGKCGIELVNGNKDELVIGNWVVTQ